MYYVPKKSIPAVSYTHLYEDSTAVIDDFFVGLPLDEDFEPEKTDSRISKWLDMVLPEFERI